jgi:putative component of membrane protein insertase Oxa1/YidC/SpoIIIJ protein YidD
LRAAAVVVSLACAACQPPAVRVGAPCASPPVFAPFDAAPPVPHATAAPDGVLDALVAWYQRHGRSREVPGAGCPFAPTCSVYAREALHRYGPLALILIVDRLLVREHGAAGEYYPAVCVAHTLRLDDDVP